MSCGGIVLCGGQSRRMGQPKAWLPFAGELLLPRVVRRLSEVVQPVVVVAAPGQDVPPLPSEISVVRDEVFGRGPLQGLVAGLNFLNGQLDAAYLSSCDVPFLRPEFVCRMMQLLGEYQACVPRVDGFYHSLAAVYRLEILAAVQRLLDRNQFRANALFEAVPTRVVEAAELVAVDPGLESLRNLNTPEDYEKALRSSE